MLFQSSSFPNTLQSRKMANTRQKCLQLSILNVLGVIFPSANWKAGRMPHQPSPADSTVFMAQQQGTWQYLMAQLTKTMVSTVWKTTCAAAMPLSRSILKPARLQSSQQIQRMPQKCWCCQAIMYTNMAKGSTMQQLRPEAIHPRYTGRLPTTDPTRVFHYEVRFILVQMNRQLLQMVAPIAAVIGLYQYSPARPSRPRPIPLQSAYRGSAPRTNGRCEVRTICLSQSTSMYWLRAWLDMERAMEERKSGRGERAVAYMLQLPTVTIPLSTESLNLVRSQYRRIALSSPQESNLLIIIYIQPEITKF